MPKPRKPRAPKARPAAQPVEPEAGPPPFHPNSRTRWVIYGVFTDHSGNRRAITDENLKSEEEAAVRFVTHYLTQGRSLLGVMVRLDNGQDVNGERHVVRRAGGGKAWWE